ncbi:MAG TPA: hypothetical protein PKU95_04095 [Candidatus Dojkabacteria bacterium]|nr:hypothetical protein [Candidatus Dojkabacteria bacterium]
MGGEILTTNELRTRVSDSPWLDLVHKKSASLLLADISATRNLFNETGQGVLSDFSDLLPQEGEHGAIIINNREVPTSVLREISDRPYRRELETDCFRGVPASVTAGILRNSNLGIDLIREGDPNIGFSFATVTSLIDQSARARVDSEFPREEFNDNFSPRTDPLLYRAKLSNGSKTATIIDVLRNYTGINARYFGNPSLANLTITTGLPIGEEFLAIDLMVEMLEAKNSGLLHPEAQIIFQTQFDTSERLDKVINIFNLLRKRYPRDIWKNLYRVIETRPELPVNYHEGNEIVLTPNGIIGLSLRNGRFTMPFERSALRSTYYNVPTAHGNTLLQYQDDMPDPGVIEISRTFRV